MGSRLAVLTEFKGLLSHPSPLAIGGMISWDSYCSESLLEAPGMVVLEMQDVGTGIHWEVGNCWISVLGKKNLRIWTLLGNKEAIQEDACSKLHSKKKKKKGTKSKCLPGRQQDATQLGWVGKQKTVSRYLCPLRSHIFPSLWWVRSRLPMVLAPAQICHVSPRPRC